MLLPLTLVLGLVGPTVALSGGSGRWLGAPAALSTHPRLGLLAPLERARSPRPVALSPAEGTGSSRASLEAVGAAEGRELARESTLSTPPTAPFHDRILLLAVSAAYGTNYASVKLLGEWFSSPAEAAALRFGIALAALAPALTVLAARDPRYVSWPLARDGISVGVCFAAGYAVQALALETSQAAVQAFILSLTVVVCPLLEWLALGHPPRTRAAAAAALALAGVSIIEAGSFGSGAPSAGDALGLLQPVCFGSGFVVLAQAMGRHRTGERDVATAVALTAWQVKSKQVEQTSLAHTPSSHHTPEYIPYGPHFESRLITAMHLSIPRPSVATPPSSRPPPPPTPPVSVTTHHSHLFTHTPHLSHVPCVFLFVRAPSFSFANAPDFPCVGFLVTPPPRVFFFVQMTAIAPLTLCWWLSSAAPALTGDSGVDAAAVVAVGAQMFAQLADVASAGGALPLLILLWTGVVTCAVCCVAEAKALGTLSSSEATVIFATEPLWAVVFALLLLDEVNQAPIFPTCDTPSHPLFSHISAFSSFFFESHRHLE